MFIFFHLAKQTSLWKRSTHIWIKEDSKNISTNFQFSRSAMSNSLQPHKLQHVRLPCPSSTPGASSNLCPSSRWCHPTISSSVVPFSSCLQSFPASGSFPMSQFFKSGGQSVGVSASVLPMNIQGWNLESCAHPNLSATPPFCNYRKKNRGLFLPWFLSCTPA